MDELDQIICTHVHPDHIGAVRELAAEREVEVLMHPADLAGLSVRLRDAVANRNRIVHTPGNTPGSVCLYAPGRSCCSWGMRFR